MKIISCIFLTLFSSLSALHEGNIPETTYGDRRHPIIGRYNPQEYHFAHVHTVLRLTRNQFAAFPEALQTHFKDYSDEALDIYLIVYSDEDLMTGNTRRNLVFHHCAYPDGVPGQSYDTRLKMGLFQAYGINPDKTTEGIPFDRFGEQRLTIHPADNHTAFSPNNCRFIFEKNSPIASFFTGAELPDHRAVAAFFVLFHDPSSYYGEVLLHASQEGSSEDFFISLVDSELPQEVLAPMMGIFARMRED